MSTVEPLEEPDPRDVQIEYDDVVKKYGHTKAAYDAMAKRASFEVSDGNKWAGLLFVAVARRLLVEGAHKK